eukprot:655165-Amorphochlora_amoeboformis.AAC.1
MIEPEICFATLEVHSTPVHLRLGWRLGLGSHYSACLSPGHSQAHSLGFHASWGDLNRDHVLLNMVS